MCTNQECVLIEFILCVNRWGLQWIDVEGQPCWFAWNIVWIPEKPIKYTNTIQTIQYSMCQLVYSLQYAYVHTYSNIILMYVHVCVHMNYSVNNIYNMTYIVRYSSLCMYVCHIYHIFCMYKAHIPIPVGIFGYMFRYLDLCPKKLTCEDWLLRDTFLQFS